jgi:hypothetical protein
MKFLLDLPKQGDEPGLFTCPASRPQLGEQRGGSLAHVLPKSLADIGFHLLICHRCSRGTGESGLLAKQPTEVSPQDREARLSHTQILQDHPNQADVQRRACPADKGLELGAARNEVFCQFIPCAYPCGQHGEMVSVRETFHRFPEVSPEGGEVRR